MGASCCEKEQEQPLNTEEAPLLGNGEHKFLVEEQGSGSAAAQNKENRNKNMEKKWEKMCLQTKAKTLKKLGQITNKGRNIPHRGYKKRSKSHVKCKHTLQLEPIKFTNAKYSYVKSRYMDSWNEYVTNTSTQKGKSRETKNRVNSVMGESFEVRRPKKLKTQSSISVCHAAQFAAPYVLCLQNNRENKQKETQGDKNGKEAGLQSGGRLVLKLSDLIAKAERIKRRQCD